MGNWAIRVDNISKLYRIGARVDRHATLRDQISEVLAAPFRRNHSGGSADTIWALKDVSFEVPRGEVVGIIGRNGAGKSTLLKILSRITEPTRGCAEIAGRVGSLLEVGTGFHPELTGRENIYLNGAILGMRRAEIDSKFEEIVAFAEIDKFIDTPVKKYSSGMYMRLAFAVAAHLEPEILLVDEVLAVGDADFQKKCLGKMGDVAKEGRTVLFVSHNLGHMGRLCETGLWLAEGRAVRYGPMGDAIASYQQSLDGADLLDGDGGRSRDRGFISWRIVDAPAEDGHRLVAEDPLTLEIVLRVGKAVHNGHHGLVLQTASGQNVVGWGVNGLSLREGTYRLLWHIRGLPVRPGIYYWYASLWDGSERVDVTHLRPEFAVATPYHSELDDSWAGIVNVKSDLVLEPVTENVSSG
ncbi:MAG: polysaccharide ABC transporter ATP-binding protein [Chloroflexi bacterium]|nr:polysaccharide ABC transporter ATP-binding protein [Chloroflexota bacterium]